MNLVSGSYKVNPRKKEKCDTRNSWHTFMLVSKCRYEHHESIGKDREQVANYIRSQPEHHRINRTFVQRCVFDFAVKASGDTACSEPN